MPIVSRHASKIKQKQTRGRPAQGRGATVHTRDGLFV